MKFAGCFLRAVPGCLLASTLCAGEPVFLDPDGPGVNDPILVVDNLDFAPGNTLARGGITAISQGPEGRFTAYVQARLSNIQLGGIPITGLGLNSSYEITMVMGFGEKVVSTLDLSSPPDGLSEFASFGLAEGDVNFIELWQGAIDADDLAGTGFNNGTRMLRGVVSNVSGNFFVNSFSPVQYDQFPNIASNDYPGRGSVTGAGNTFPLKIRVEEVNGNYFTGLSSGDTITIDLLNVSQNVPFQGANPSRLFTAAAGGGAPSVVPALGAVNGINGPDFQFQTDHNLVFTVTPEEMACRVTGGGVNKDGSFDLTKLAEANNTTRYTFGGQVGAPTATQPDPQGNWQHNQHGKNNFAFHIPQILSVACSDPGFCDPARPAFFKQIHFTGVGVFNNVKGFPYVVGSTHYAVVDIKDMGEPGPGGKQPHSPDCPYTAAQLLTTDLSAVSGLDVGAVCASCADVYRIRIYATEDPVAPGAVIYEVGGFIDAGNLQIHPEIK